MSAAPALILIGLVAAAVIGLYLLRPPPQRLRIASTLIWERVLGTRSAAKQRWRWWLSLLLALLIALAVALALVRPGEGGAGGEDGELVVVVDNSPTMNAWRSDGRTRFDHAVEAARELVRSGPASRRVLVTDTMRTSGAGTFGDRVHAEAVLDALEPAAGGLARFPDLAMLPPAAGTRTVVFVSDGVAPVTLPEGVVRRSVFEAARNVGVTSFAVQPRPANVTRYEAFVEIGNAGTVPAGATVTLSGVGRDPVSRVIRVPARGFASVSVPVESFGGGALRATVAAEGDDLDIDNTAYAFLPFNRALRVALVTRGNAVLARALALDPRVRLAVLTPAQYAKRTGFDVYVFDGFAPPVQPLAPALVLAPPAVPWLPEPGPAIRDPVVQAWLASATVLENVSLADVQLERARGFADPGPALTVLARAAGGQPVVVASDRAPRWIAAGFGLADSNFASQASFPVFLANSLGWLTAEVPPQATAVGPQSVPFENARATAMNGGRLATRSVPGATLFTVRAADFVTVEAEGVRTRRLVNVLDPAVTDINATSFGVAGETAAAAGVPEAVASGTTWWPVLIAIAFAAAVLEWLGYHRRVTV